MRSAPSRNSISDEEPEIKPAEKAMAEQLIGAMTGAFDPGQYRDEYRTALMEIIESKVEGREVTAAAPAEESSNLIDLMAALEASVKKAKEAREAITPPPTSVADAKAKKAARADAPATKAAAKTKASTAAADAAAEEAKPARRRKSA